MTIGFIGLGNMAKAIISGMLAKEVVKPSMLSGSARTKETREAVQKKYGIAVYEENRQVAREADILVLAVKPQMMETVIGEIRGDIKPDAVVVSIAAGKSLAWIGTERGGPQCGPPRLIFWKIPWWKPSIGDTQGRFFCL